MWVYAEHWRKNQSSGKVAYLLAKDQLSGSTVPERLGKRGFSTHLKRLIVRASPAFQHPCTRLTHCLWEKGPEIQLRNSYSEQRVMFPNDNRESSKPLCPAGESYLLPSKQLLSLKILQSQWAMFQEAIYLCLSLNGNILLGKAEKEMWTKGC